MSRVLFFLLASASSMLAAATLSGPWAGTMETNGGTVRIYIILTQNGSAVAGTIATGDPTQAMGIEKAEIHDDQVSFDVPDNAGRVIHFRLAAKDAELTGEATVEGRSAKVALARPRSAGDRPAPPQPPLRPGVYRVGNGVSAPSLIYKMDPEYSEEARAARYQGTVLLYLEVGPDGKPTNIKVQRSLGLGLDEKAIEAVKHWQFKPGMKDGQPVTVAATLEVNFRL